jgi:hypothetical protein
MDTYRPQRFFERTFHPPGTSNNHGVEPPPNRPAPPTVDEVAATFGQLDLAGHSEYPQQAAQQAPSAQQSPWGQQIYHPPAAPDGHVVLALLSQARIKKLEYDMRYTFKGYELAKAATCTLMGRYWLRRFDDDVLVSVPEDSEEVKILDRMAHIGHHLFMTEFERLSYRQNRLDIKCSLGHA